jgi:MFS family permease
VYIVSAVSFAQDAASDMLYPLLPTFLVRTLGAPVATVGLVEGVADATSALSKIIAGRLSEGRPKKPWIFAGYGLALVGKLIVAAAGLWPVVLAGRFVDRVGKGTRGAPRDALIVDVTPAAARGRAFGLHRACDTAGAVLGPLLGLGLLQLFHGRVRPVLFVALVPAAVSVTLVALLRERPGPRFVRTGAPLVPVPLGAAYWTRVAPLIAFGLANSADAFLLLRAAVLGLSTAQVVGAYALLNAVNAAAAYPVAAFSDRVDRRHIIAAGLVLFATAYGGLALVHTAAYVWFLLPVYGLSAACTDAVVKAWVADAIPPDRRAWGIGVHQGLVGAAALAAATWTGLLWHDTGRVPLLLSAIAAVALAAVFSSSLVCGTGTAARTRRLTGAVSDEAARFLGHPSAQASGGDEEPF